MEWSVHQEDIRRPVSLEKMPSVACHHGREARHRAAALRPQVLGAQVPRPVQQKVGWVAVGSGDAKVLHAGPKRRRLWGIIAGAIAVPFPRSWGTTPRLSLPWDCTWGRESRGRGFQERDSQRATLISAELWEGWPHSPGTCRGRVASWAARPPQASTGIGGQTLKPGYCTKVLPSKSSHRGDSTAPEEMGRGLLGRILGPVCVFFFVLP